MTSHKGDIHVGGPIDSSGGGICPFYLTADVSTLNTYETHYWDCNSPDDVYSIDNIYVTRTSTGTNADELIGIGLARDASTFAQSNNGQYVMVQAKSGIFCGNIAIRLITNPTST